MDAAEPRRKADAPPRMSDVARAAGVSATTVSFVLSERENMRISEATRQRVLRTARDLGYRPNLVARSLRTGEHRSIGLISDGIASGEYAGALVRGCLEAAVQHRHLLAVAETEHEPHIAAWEITELVSRGVDRFVYATGRGDEISLPPGLAGHDVVLLNCLGGPQTPAVLADEAQGGRSAADVLLSAGHRRGIFLIGETQDRVLAARDRRDGLQAALREAGVELAGQVECTWWPDAAFEAVSELVRRSNEPCAFVCLNDRIALGTYQALAAAGLQIPADISVVSFDDSPLAAWLRPQLTSVALPYLTMGRLAVHKLLGGDPADVTRVPMPVRHRASVAAPRPEGPP